MKTVLILASARTNLPGSRVRAIVDAALNKLKDEEFTPEPCSIHEASTRRGGPK